MPVHGPEAVPEPITVKSAAIIARGLTGNQIET
jgi:hypothetical protein